MPRTRPRGYYLSPIRDAHAEMPQPIFIDAHGWTMPGAVAAGFKGPHRETGDELSRQSCSARAQKASAAAAAASLK